MPELELRQAADEGSELLVLLGGETGGTRIPILKTLVMGEGGIEFGSKESKEEVQEVNAESVGNCGKKNANVSYLFTSYRLAIDVDGACWSPISISRDW